MLDKNDKILFEYLQNILHDPKVERLDITKLDEAYREVGLILQEVHKRIEGAAMAEDYNELLGQLTSKRREWIVVIDSDSREILFCNKKNPNQQGSGDFCERCKYTLSFRRDLLRRQSDEDYLVWETQDAQGRFYQITSFFINWKHRNAYAHVISDITKEKQEARRLTKKAYHDPGTGIANRLYFEEYMAQVLEEKEDVTLCYLDLDGLKYVNDRYGHLEGDEYIRSFVYAIKEHIRRSDVFARVGGDEFCVVFFGRHKKELARKMEETLKWMQTENKKEYPVGFSFGIVEVVGESQHGTLEDILKCVDEEMYKCKREHKQKIRNDQI